MNTRFKLAGPRMIYVAKTCSCGRKFTHLPFSTTILNDGSLMSGAYFNCICDSTNFIKLCDLPKNMDLVAVKERVA